MITVNKDYRLWKQASMKIGIEFIRNWSWNCEIL